MRSKSSMTCGGTTTIGALWNMFARECANPENCVPAMGWQPTKVQSCRSAIAKQWSQMTRLTPTVSMTMAPGAMRSCLASSHSTLI